MDFDQGYIKTSELEFILGEGIAVKDETFADAPVRAEYIAGIIGNSAKYVRELAREGVIPRTARGKYPLGKALRAWHLYIIRKAILDCLSETFGASKGEQLLDCLVNTEKAIAGEETIRYLEKKGIKVA